MIGAVLLAAMAPQAAPAEPLGIPVFVSIFEGRCIYQVQDMLMGRSQMAEWLAGSYDRADRIAIVRKGGRDISCARRAVQTLRQHRFRNLRIHIDSRDAYGPSPYR